MFTLPLVRFGLLFAFVFDLQEFAQIGVVFIMPKLQHNHGAIITYPEMAVTSDGVLFSRQFVVLDIRSIA